MVDLQSLFKAVDQLDSQELEQLSEYIAAHKALAHPPVETKPRIVGLHAHLGKGWMSPDFDAELPDSFWLGEE
jgi:hypothetical protein